MFKLMNKKIFTVLYSLFCLSRKMDKRDQDNENFYLTLILSVFMSIPKHLVKVTTNIVQEKDKDLESH